ncbi:MAG: hypothetical protein XD93_0081 [candidate division WS6 bacterium 34_10]|uniref:Class I SAM-dependent methyltransferase n=1 Tax=candidate division WS6 bacterium 34_10 TaxID=1641389 RepID=A0A101HJU5_9BACT|nr:MAG: hypothetical protein XD93_0081 [candidate division WS6 bacterium 34_10]
MASNWEIYTSHFEFHDELPLNEAPWGGHCFFAYDLVTNYKPKTIVELGTYKGYSFFSFAQAVKDHKLDTQLHCIDTWQGDKHAGFYDEGLYKGFIHIYKKYYKDVDVDIHRETFDGALKDFKDNSVDLLHIDGLHTYEAVKHDFKSWLPKVKKDGIIILHDVCEIRDDFGVYKLWKELQAKYKNTLTFEHFHGLGVIFLGKPPKVQEEFLMKYYSLRSELESLITSPEVNSINNYKREVDLLNMQIEDKSKLINELSEEVKDLATEVNEFRGFKKSPIWRTLVKWRKVKSFLRK